ncbi:MAG: hypothetical protein RI897_621 [Verrucomicrobiota bacterium]
MVGALLSPGMRRGEWIDSLVAGGNFESVGSFGVGVSGEVGPGEWSNEASGFAGGHREAIACGGQGEAKSAGAAGEWFYGGAVGADAEIRAGQLDRAGEVWPGDGAASGT